MVFSHMSNSFQAREAVWNAGQTGPLQFEEWGCVYCSVEAEIMQILRGFNHYTVTSLTNKVLREGHS